MKAIYLIVLALVLYGCGDFAETPVERAPSALTCASLDSNAEVRSRRQAATFAREACTRIDGDVLITGNYDVEFSSSVEEIAGTLFIADYAGDEFRLFNELNSVGELVLLRSSAASIAFPALETAGSVRVEGALGTELGWPDLNSVESLEIVNSASLLTVSMPSLTASTGTLKLYDLPALTTLTMSSLQQVGGSLIVERVGLRSLQGLGSLNRVVGSFSVAKNPDLQDVSTFPSLNSVGGTIGFAQCPSLSEINGFESLRDHDGLLAVTDMENLSSIAGLQRLSSLWSLELSRLPRIQAGSGFEELTDLQALYLDQLDPSWEFSELGVSAPISSVFLARVTLANLSGMELATDADVTLGFNESLIDISTVVTPTQLGIFLARGNAFESIGWASVTSMRDLTIRLSPALVTIDLPELTRIEREFEIIDLANLGDELGLGQLSTVGEDLDIRNCSSLTTLQFPALRAVEDDFLVSYNDSLRDLSEVDLDRVVDEVSFNQNESLPSCEVEAFVARIEDGPQSTTNTGNDGAGTCN